MNVNMVIVSKVCGKHPYPLLYLTDIGLKAEERVRVGGRGRVLILIQYGLSSISAILLEHPLLKVRKL